MKLHFPNKIWKNREQKTFKQTECPEASVHSAQQMSPSPQQSLRTDPNLQVATWPVSDSDIMWHLEDQSDREWRMRGDRWGKKWKTTTYAPAARGWTPLCTGLRYSMFSQGECEQCKSAFSRRATAEQLDPLVASSETLLITLNWVDVGTLLKICCMSEKEERLVLHHGSLSDETGGKVKGVHLYRIK